MNAKGTKKVKKKLQYGNGSIYFVEKRNRFAGQITLMIDGEKVRKTVYGKTEKIVKDIRSWRSITTSRSFPQESASPTTNPQQKAPSDLYPLGSLPLFVAAGFSPLAKQSKQWQKSWRN